MVQVHEKVVFKYTVALTITNAGGQYATLTFSLLTQQRVVFAKCLNTGRLLSAELNYI